MNGPPIDDLPNPFAEVFANADEGKAAKPTRSFGRVVAEPNRTGRHPGNRLGSLLKRLVLIAGGLALILTLANRGPGWLAAYLMKDFDGMTVTQQQNRLIQVASLGIAGIDPLVAQLPSADRQRSQLANTLLTDLQNTWITLDPDDRHRRHGRLVDSIDGLAEQLDDSQISMAVRLISQSRLAGVGHDGEEAAFLVRRCDDLLDRLTFSSRSGPSVLDDEVVDPRSPTRLVVRPRTIAAEPVNSRDPGATGNGLQDPSAGRSDPPMRILRSGSGGLQPIAPDDPIVLKDIHHDATPASPKPPQRMTDSPEVSPNVSVVSAPDPVTATKPVILASSPPISASPVETFVDESIFPILHHDDPSLREAAEIELRSRGYQSDDLHLAAMAGSPDVADRLALVDHLAGPEPVDPRPWLRRLLSDSHRDVRLRTISVIASIDDPNASSLLRLHLTSEQDPVVAARLRRILDLR